MEVNFIIESTLKDRQNIVSVLNMARKMCSDTAAFSHTTRYDSSVKHLAFKHNGFHRKIDELLNTPSRFRRGLL